MAGTSGKKPKSARSTSGTPARPTGCSCPVAGIGASAGGLEAFTGLLRALPAHVGMALVVVQHLDPTQASLLADILGRASKMPVSEATHGLYVQPDHVYVIPPNATMRLSAGSIVLEERPKPPEHVLPVDALFRSLADECGHLSIGVVLSGTGTDGAMGLAAIKEAGGLTLAQDPATAEYAGMPKASVDAGVIDRVLDIEDIAAELVRIGGHLASTERGSVATAASALDEESLAQIIRLVRDSTGLDLSSYRRTTVVRRVERRMLLEDVATMHDYLRTLREHPSRVDVLYRDVLVNMTEFFRDPGALDALTREAFPEILERRGAEGPIRIWVPGCSKGQEAYSILISLTEFFGAGSPVPTIQMFATDVNERDVEIARAGVYPQGITSEVSPERLSRYFVQVPGGYQIERSIREMCVFATHDVTKDPPFSKLDLVSMRNVLIYMERPLQSRVLQILHYALEPGGFLLLGSSETTGTESTLFSIANKKHRIYRRKPGPGRLLAAYAPTAGGAATVARSVQGGPESVFDVLAEADRVVRDTCQPAGILVTPDLDVLQFRGQVGPYIDPAEGTPELKLLRLVAPALTSTVAAAVREAAKTRAAAQRRGAIPEGDGSRREVEVKAVPVIAPSGELYYLVLFKERPRESSVPEPGTKPGQGRSAGAPGEAVLRQELDEARRQLDAVLSEREAANSELRAASERLQSSNEELRTINEEFQTAQEELQSTNEELTTLNDELRNRNTELGRLADDLNNVIDGVEMPILLLDTDLRIRRFTPQADAIVSIVPADVGRPITDLSLKVDTPEFRGRVQEVLRRGARSETEVRSTDGRWYSMRVRPYMTSDGVVDGVVVVFVDIDALKADMHVVEAARDHAKAVVATVQEPLLTLGPDLCVRDANDAFYGTFAASVADTVGRPVHELAEGQWDFPELRFLLERVLSGDEESVDLEVEREFPVIGRRITVLGARRVREKGGKPSILLTISDVTERRCRERLSTALNDISVILGSTLEFDQILDGVLREASEALNAHSGAVVLKKDEAWVTTNVHGLPRALVGRVLSEDGIPLASPSSRTGEPVFLGDSSKDSRFASSIGMGSGEHSVLVVPLLLREEEMGFVSLQCDPSRAACCEHDTAFAKRLGTLLSLAIENAHVYSTQLQVASSLEDLSNRDPLTGVLNHRGFHAAASERVAKVTRSQMVLVYLDLDGLKATNDEYGHPAGDEALATLAGALRAAFRESDIIGRLGGDEFAVLATSRQRVSDKALMARFSKALRERNAMATSPFEVSVSYGIAWRDPVDEPADLERLISLADARMYEARRAR